MKIEQNINNTNNIDIINREIKHHKIDAEKIENNIKETKKEHTKEELEKVVENLNKVMSNINNDLKFQFNDKAETLIVQVVDKKDDKIIREFPPKEALHLMEKMRELIGILFNQKG